MEEFLSQKGLAFTLRDVVTDPITPDELWALLHDAEGRQLGPLTRIAGAVVLGYDPVRLGEYLAGDPAAARQGATVYGRPGEAGTAGVLAWLAEHGVPATLVDVDATPLSREELWDLLKLPGDANVRTPFTRIDGTVVLGNDRRRLEEVLARRG